MSSMTHPQPLFSDRISLFYRFPRKFWITLGGTVIIFALSLFNWTNITTVYQVTQWQEATYHVNFNLYSLLFTVDGADYWISMSASHAEHLNWDLITNLFRFVLPLTLIAGLALLVLAVIRYKSDQFRLLSYIGFSITAVVPLLFYIFMLLINSQNPSVTNLNGATPVPWPLVLLFIVVMAMFLLNKDDKRLTLLWHQKAFFLMIIPVMIYVFVFSYLPLAGWQMAFQLFRPGRAVQEWVGFDNFARLFTSGDFTRVMINTLAMSFINLILGFTTAIFLALMINEIRQRKFKRVVQTISYLPHFLSWVIAAGIIRTFLGDEGILNDILRGLGIREAGNQLLLLSDPDRFWWVFGWSNVWKSVGWNTIIYLAAITAIDPELYESAEIDGAGRFKKMWHITLPGIKSTILVLVIMNMGWILNAGFEVQWLLENPSTRAVAESIDVFVIRWGIHQGNYSLATALGMFRTLVAVILITAANFASKRFAQESLV